MKKKKKDKKISFVYIILLAIFLFIFLVCLLNFINSNKKFNVSDLIINDTYDVVYDMGSYPIINLNGDVIDEINGALVDYYSLNPNGDSIEYEYSLSEDTLSLLITRHIIVENKEYLEYVSYNIDLINMKELSYEELLEKFDVTDEELSFFVKNKFLNYYADLIDKGYLEGNKCDFDCFLINCNFQDLNEGHVLYIKKNHLYLYKFFDIYNDYNYNEYFSYDDFIFNVK